MGCSSNLTLQPNSVSATLAIRSSIFSLNLIIPEFNLGHHTQYNFMRQEQSMIKKKLNIDYVKTQKTMINML